jgi:hypothetical protein
MVRPIVLLPIQMRLQLHLLLIILQTLLQQLVHLLIGDGSVLTATLLSPQLGHFSVQVGKVVSGSGLLTGNFLFGDAFVHLNHRDTLLKLVVLAGAGHCWLLLVEAF